MVFVFKFIKGLLPKVFDHFFQRNSEVSSRVTHNSHKLHLPKFKTALYKSSIKYQCVTEWNSKTDLIDDKCSVHTFKKKVKHFLMKE